MKKYLFLILFSFLVIGWSKNSHNIDQQYPGTNLRGQVLTNNGYGQLVPFSNARVDLLFYNGTQWLILGTVFTDISGIYFFRYVPPNVYTIQINGTRNFNIQVQVIDYRYFQFQELGQLIY